MCVLIICTGTVSAATYSGGSGTSGDPYLLSSDSDIDNLSASSGDWNSYFKLTQNITLVGNHTPIGIYPATAFRGDFNGSGYAITNLTVYYNTDGAGFFGYTNSANIHDLGVESSSDGVVGTDWFVGVLAGYTSGGTVSNCYATGNANGSVSGVAVLVGYNSYGTINNSYAIGTATADHYHVGVLVGENFGTVNSCYAIGNATGDGNVGGLVGMNSHGIVTNSYATGNANASVTDAGGLVGRNYEGTVSNCYATGTADASYSSSGGLVGENNGNVTNCFATGSATVSLYNGGLVGSDTGTVTNSYYSGSPIDGNGTFTSFADFTSFAFVSGSSGLYWNESGNNITTADNTDFVWKIIDGYTLPFFQNRNAPAPLAPYIVSIYPGFCINNSDRASSYWINVTGACFNVTDTVHVNLTMDGQTTITGSIDSITYTTINATFDLTQAIAGDWSLTVINPDGQTSTATNFAVKTLSTPESFTNTTGNFWVNHSWNADTSGVTDSYNISYNGTWLNGTTTNSFNHTGLFAHAWSNLTVYAYNATEPMLSDGATYNVWIPNNDVTILNVTDITVNGGDNIIFDINSTDADNDTPTFNCSRISLFDNFNTSTGEGSWSTDLSDAGTYSVEFTVSDGYGSVDSQLITIRVIGSSSGTRASVSQGQDPAIVSTSASSVIRVTGGSEVNYDFSDSGTSVLGVSFDAKDDEGLVVAKVQVLSSNPDGVPTPSGESYQMMSIDVGSEGTISSDSADNVMIHFKVSKQWIEDNNIDVSTIRMSRYHGEQWNDLPTTQENEDGEYYYFYAETPGFSVFSVVGDEVSDTPVETTESSTSVAEEVEKPIAEEETSSTPGFTALAGIVFVSLAFFVSRKQR